jgi:murein L,D-transpeptidase YcbB/YkuD
MQTRFFRPSLIIPIVSVLAVAVLVGIAASPKNRPPQTSRAETSTSGERHLDARRGETDSPARSPKAEGGRRSEEFPGNIVALLESDRLSVPGAKRFARDLLAYYGDHNGTPLWVDTPRMKSLIEHLGQAEEDGLASADYPTDDLKARQQAATDGDSIARAEAEIAFSAAFLNYASDLKVGRLSPRKVDPELFVENKVFDGSTALGDLNTQDDVDIFFRLYAPKNPEYRALRVLLSTYRKIVAKGGWPKVAKGEPLKPDMRDPRVAQIRARLKITGDITVDSADPALFDAALVMAVKRFQKRHGLDADGAAGRKTIAAMNVTADERVEQIIVNLERWRWLPENLGDRYILVNIAGFELTLVESGAVQDRMRVIVGRPFRRTPVFDSRIRYLEINPYWTVPYKLAVEDELPQILKDPSFIDRLGFEVFRDGKPVNPNTVQWASLSEGNFPYTLRQKPGPKNALGRIKFMFPNKFSVYLHDTPSRGLFGRAERAFSSGCIRVQRPLDLAEQVLRDTPDWDRAHIEAVLESEKNTRVNLAKSLPVHLTYATAWSGEGGTIEFRPDIYGRDKSLGKALFGK